MTENRRFLFEVIGLIVVYFLLSAIALWLVTSITPLIWLGQTSQGQLFYTLLSVGLIHVLLFPFVKFVKGRDYLELLGRFDLKLGISANLLAVASFFIAEWIFLWIFHTKMTFSWGGSLWVWLVWIIPFMIVTFLQVTAEEFFFRGFIQGELERLNFSHTAVILIPAIMWTIPHWGNVSIGHIKPSFLILIFTLALIMGDMVQRQRSLIGPITLHFAFNIFSMCIYANNLRSTSMLAYISDAKELPNLIQSFYFIWLAIPLAIIYLVMRERV